MHPGLFGGVLILGSCLLLLVAAAIAAPGGSVGVGSHDLGGFVLTAALASAGIGGGAMSLRPPRELGHRSIRIGLAILAVGLLDSVASAIIGASMAGDPLESMPAVILLLLGGATALVGAGTTVLSLLVRAGRPRRLASQFVLGLLLAAIAGAVSNGLFPNSDSVVLAVMTRTLGLLGGSAMLSAAAGMALLGVRPGSSTGVWP